MMIDRLDPFIQELPLGPVLLAVLSFGFQDQQSPIGQPDQEVRPVFMDHSLKKIEDVKTEVIVFYPGLNRWNSS